MEERLEYEVEKDKEDFAAKEFAEKETAEKEKSGKENGKKNTVEKEAGRKNKEIANVARLTVGQEGIM